MHVYNLCNHDAFMYLPDTYKCMVHVKLVYGECLHLLAGPVAFVDSVMLTQVNANQICFG